MTKSYADQCLDRAQKATVNVQLWNDVDRDFFNVARTEMIPELATRLKRACEMLRRCDDRDPYFHFMKKLADELEAPLGEK